MLRLETSTGRAASIAPGDFPCRILNTQTRCRRRQSEHPPAEDFFCRRLLIAHRRAYLICQMSELLMGILRRNGHFTDFVQALGQLQVNKMTLKYAGGLAIIFHGLRKS